MKCIASTIGFVMAVSAFALSGCATKYNLSSPQITQINAKASLPNGAADRIIIRIDNDKEDWLHVNWGEAKIVGITGFAVPTKVKPGNPLDSIPPKSSVEYHVYPDHAYLPAGQLNQRRDGFSTLLVYDSDYNRMVASSQAPALSLYIPVCQGEGTTCSGGSETGEGWAMSRLHGLVRRTQ